MAIHRQFHTRPQSGLASTFSKKKPLQTRSLQRAFCLKPLRRPSKLGLRARTSRKWPCCRRIQHRFDDRCYDCSRLPSYRLFFCGRFFSDSLFGCWLFGCYFFRCWLFSCCFFSDWLFLCHCFFSYCFFSCRLFGCYLFGRRLFLSYDFFSSGFFSNRLFLSDRFLLCCYFFLCCCHVVLLHVMEYQATSLKPV